MRFLVRSVPLHSEGWWERPEGALLASGSGLAYIAPFGHARLPFSKSHDRKGAHGSKNRPIPSGIASPVTTNHAAKGSVFVNVRNADNLNNWPTCLANRSSELARGRCQERVQPELLQPALSLHLGPSHTFFFFFFIPLKPRVE